MPVSRSSSSPFVAGGAAHDRLADCRQALRVRFGGEPPAQAIRCRRAEARRRQAPQQLTLVRKAFPLGVVGDAVAAGGGRN